MGLDWERGKTELLLIRLSRPWPPINSLDGLLEHFLNIPHCSLFQTLGQPMNQAMLLCRNESSEMGNAGFGGAKASTSQGLATLSLQGAHPGLLSNETMFPLGVKPHPQPYPVHAHLMCLTSGKVFIPSQFRQTLRDQTSESVSILRRQP